MISKKTIKKWNEHFKSLTKAEQRVAIAKDVIKSIKTGFYKAESSYFDIKKIEEFKTYDERYWTIPSEKGKLDAQANFDMLKGCRVCGIGSCLVSLVKFTDKANIFDLTEEKDDMFLRLSKFFPLRQLHYIETIFENMNSYNSYTKACNLGFKVKDRDYVLLTQWADMKKDPYPKGKNLRLIAIMENIVRNKGEFKPLDFPAKKASKNNSK